MYNTRFNPTINGAIHLGHLYTAFVNQAVSRESEGRFIVRYDDSNPAWVSQLGRDRMELIIKEQREDMEWMGLNPYYWKKQSDIIDEAQEWIGKRLTLLPDDALPATPGIIGGEGLVLYPLTATLTAEKVVMDWMDGINMLIRGLDLITEYSLYQYYCRVFELPEPKHIYLPRLKWMHGEMSKSAGSQTVCELRSSGYAPRQVKDRLETACLILPINGWTLDNLKGSPRW